MTNNIAAKVGGEISIRSFTPSDQDRVKALILGGLGEHFDNIVTTRNLDLNDIQESYIRQGSLFLVAELDGALVGTGALISEIDDVGRIVRVSVDISHRRRGIGRLITNHLIEAARKVHFRRLVVETNDDWFDAIYLYQHCGFVEYDRFNGEVHMIFHLYS